MKRKWIICSLVLMFSLLIGGCNLFKKDDDKKAPTSQQSNSSSSQDDADAGETSSGSGGGRPAFPTKPDVMAPEHVLN